MNNMAKGKQGKPHGQKVASSQRKSVQHKINHNVGNNMKQIRRKEKGE